MEGIPKELLPSPPPTPIKQTERPDILIRVRADLTRAVLKRRKSWTRQHQELRRWSRFQVAARAKEEWTGKSGTIRIWYHGRAESRRVENGDDGDARVLVRGNACCLEGGAEFRVQRSEVRVQKSEFSPAEVQQIEAIRSLAVAQGTHAANRDPLNRVIKSKQATNDSDRLDYQLILLHN